MVTEIFNKNIIFPAYMLWNKDNRLRRLKEIEQRQWLSEDEVIHYQFQSFVKILRYSYKHVPFYNKLYTRFQVSPDDIKSIHDIKKLPIITKMDIQSNYEFMMSDICEKSQGYKDASGGSTGQPTNFLGDWHSVYKKHAALLMANKWSGWDIGQKSFYLWGADREVNKMRDFKEKAVQKYVYRHELLNAFEITDEKMEAFAQQMLKHKPSLIIAYANAAFEFANYVRGRSLSGISPKGIICSAETLTEEKRTVIKGTFNCRVLNRYGSREVGLVASECEAEHGLHINANDVFVELMPINKASNDENGSEVIVTDFNNHVMPFIRYNMGDMSFPVLSKCGCGRGFPMIGSITGRTSDFIVHPDGKRIHGEFFSHVFYGISGISRYQIVQRTINEIDINIVANDQLRSEDKSDILDKFNAILGDDIHLNFNEIDAIPTPESGKFRFAISLVK